MACYLRNGTRAPDVVPCDANAVREGRHTNCCDPGDLCLSNGLCRSPSVNDSTNYARYSGCTDSTYADAVCANHCDKWSTANHQLVFQCQEPDTWCCHEGNDTPLIERINTTNTRCCGYPTLVFKAPWSTVVATATGTPLPIASLMSSARFMTTSTATPTSTSTASPNTSQSSTPALGIGLGVGLGGGAVIALAIGLFVLRRRKKRQASRGPIPGGYVVEKEGDGQWPVKDNKTGMMDGRGRTELQDAEVSAELRADGYVAELPAR